ncbi:hypothetical protein PMIN02_004463 [Paraphaeosphaeria minitans]
MSSDLQLPDLDTIKDREAFYERIIHAGDVPWKVLITLLNLPCHDVKNVSVFLVDHNVSDLFVQIDKASEGVTPSISAQLPIANDLITERLRPVLEEYGPIIWGRNATDNQLDASGYRDLNWDNEHDKSTIEYLLRCCLAKKAIVREQKAHNVRSSAATAVAGTLTKADDSGTRHAASSQMLRSSTEVISLSSGSSEDSIYNDSDSDECSNVSNPSTNRSLGNGSEQVSRQETPETHLRRLLSLRSSHQQEIPIEHNTALSLSESKPSKVDRPRDLAEGFDMGRFQQSCAAGKSKYREILELLGIKHRVVSNGVPEKSEFKLIANFTAELTRAARLMPVDTTRTRLLFPPAPACTSLVDEMLRVYGPAIWHRSQRDHLESGKAPDRYWNVKEDEIWSVNALNLADSLTCCRIREVVLGWFLKEAAGHFRNSTKVEKDHDMMGKASSGIREGTKRGNLSTSSPPERVQKRHRYNHAIQVDEHAPNSSPMLGHKFQLERHSQTTERANNAIQHHDAVGGEEGTWPTVEPWTFVRAVLPVYHVSPQIQQKNDRTDPSEWASQDRRYYLNVKLMRFFQQYLFRRVEDQDDFLAELHSLWSDDKLSLAESFGDEWPAVSEAYTQWLAALKAWTEFRKSGYTGLRSGLNAYFSTVDSKKGLDLYGKVAGLRVTLRRVIHSSNLDREKMQSYVFRALMGMLRLKDAEVLLHSVLRDLWDEILGWME